MDSATPEFSITRKFKAPQELVFDAFSNATALAKWWGPVEAPIEVIHLDFKPKGTFHYKMKGSHESYGLFRYIAIDAPHKLTWINSFANEQGEIITPPFEGMDVPREIRNELTLTELDGVTTLVLVCTPVNANASEIQTFSDIADSMEHGYGGTLGQLEQYLTHQTSTTS
ncbi:MAG: SRPBCC domain-containing protein [Bacteroidota bacterium]